MRKIWFGAVACMLLAVLTIVASASARSDASGKREKEQSKGEGHHLWTSLSKKQYGLKQQALKDKLAGKPVGKVHEVAKGQFVEMELEKTDRVFVIIAELGDTRHASFPDNPAYGAQRFSGPGHNEIPQPDRSVDNSTLWQPDYDKAHYENMYFNRMDRFYRDQSSGRYSINGDVTEWVRVPFNQARYGRSGDTAGTDPAVCASIVCNNTWFLIRDAMSFWVKSKLDSGMTMAQIQEYLTTFDRWDRYDFDGDGNFDERDGYVDHFQIVHAGGDEAAGDPLYGQDAIWSHRWYAQITPIGAGGPTGLAPFGGVNAGQGGTSSGVAIPNNPTGVWVGDYTIQPENGGLGVFAHEYAHDLGLPDLYDTSGNVGGAENSTGFWTLMSSGANIGDGDGAPTGPNGIGDAPTNMGAWEKLQLGWLNFDLTEAGKKSEHRVNTLGVTTKQSQAVVVRLPKELNPNVLDLGGTQSFWSGMGDNLDHTMTRDVTLPASPVTLSFKAWYEIETCWDYAYLRVSTNGGTSWTNIQTSISDAGNENGQNFGHGITGISGQAKHCDEASGNPAWVNATADLSAFAGQTVKLQFRYWTDGFVIGRGFVVDDIAVNGTVIGTGAASEGWTFNGFSASTGGQTTLHDHFYIAEYRSYHDYDQSLATAYNFGFLNTKPDWVEYQRYQDGLLVNYWDTGESDNGVGDHPGEGLILPVDAHPTLDHWSNGELMRGRIQTADSTFGLEPTDPFTLHLNSVPTTIAPKPAVPVFDDSNTYWFGSDAHGGTGSHPGRHQPGWFGVKVPNTGTTIRVKNVQAQGLFMHVEVAPK